MMSTSVAPGLLAKINERRVLEHIQQNGPLSRAAVMRASGMSAPTVSKAVASLIRHGLLEESERFEPAFGRPGKLLQLATQTANVLGVVIDSRNCWVGMARLDGEIREDNARSFATPKTYPELLSSIEQQVVEIVRRAGGSTSRGVGISVPGLLNSQLDRIVFSPNLHLLDGQRPAIDLSTRLGMKCVVMQESHALCLGERMYGAARGLDNFAMLDISTGLGLGVVSGGRLLTGNSGMAGELGHITVDPQGIKCGCGNRGCLETVATDSAFAGQISELLGRRVEIDEALEEIHAGRVDAGPAIKKTCEYLAIAIAAVINIFNPSTLFVHGRFWSSDQRIFDDVLAEAQSRCLKPSFADCRVLQAKGNKRQGAIAGVTQNLADAWAPSLASITDQGHTNRIH